MGGCSMPIEISWLHPDGDGGGRLPRGTVRVPGALPGDVVEVDLTGRRGRVSTGALREIVRPSPDRVEPPCPWDADCGGCDLSALAEPARHRHLARTVQRALGLDAPPPVVPSPRRDYRARVQLALTDGRAGYRRRRSHDLVEVGTCGIARPEVAAALVGLRAWLADGPSEGLDRVELRSDGTSVALAFRGRPPQTVRSRLAELGDVALEGRSLHGDPTRWLQVGATRLRASPRAFYQVNLDVNERLVAHVVEQVLARAPERVADVYAGIGNLALPLAAAGLPVVAVEQEGQALRDLQAMDPSVEVVRGAAEAVDWSHVPADVVVLDPPRAGAAGAMPGLLANRPRALVYVSCHPVSGARDLKIAVAHGYRIRDVRCFDMFPDTHHVETVIVAERA